MIEVNGLRLKQAREINKITQAELADSIGVSQYVIARMEGDVRTIERRLVELIAFKTGFPISFFTKGTPPEFPVGSLLFRCRSNLQAPEIKRLRQLSSIELEMVEQLSAGKTEIDLRIPVTTGHSPKEIAQITRATLGLSPDTPIQHLINRLERNGILVFSIPKASERFDAFSLWSDTEPRKAIIIISHEKSADRIRFSCAHELGHLILHKSPRGNPADLEREANEFASEFLLPEEALKQDLKAPLTLTSIAELKPKWGVSIQALVMRAKSLDLITDRQYRYLFEQIAKRKWRKREPENLDIPMEKPRRFRKLIEMGFGIPIDIERVASAFDISTTLAEELVSIHAAHSELPKKEIREIDNEAPPRNNVVNFRK